MKKTLTSLTFVALATALLAGCGSREKLSERTRDAFDMGTIRLNNGYDLHGYRLMNGINEHDHFVYYLEKDGKPVAGTATNYDVSQGKGTRNEVVSTDIAPSTDGNVATDSSGDGHSTEAQLKEQIAELQRINYRLVREVQKLQDKAQPQS